MPAAQIRGVRGAGTSNTGVGGAGSSYTECWRYRQLKYGVHKGSASEIRGACVTVRVSAAGEKKVIGH